MKVNILSQHFTADQKLKELVHKKVDKLEQFYDRIIDAEVHLKLENNSAEIKDKIVNVAVNIPGSKLFAQESSKLFEKSLDLAVDSIRRQLKRHKQKVKAH